MENPSLAGIQPELEFSSGKGKWGDKADEPLFIRKSKTVVAVFQNQFFALTSARAADSCCLIVLGLA